MMSLKYQMVIILRQIFKIIINIFNILLNFIFSFINIIKKYKALTKIPPIHVCINRINIRLVFKIKDGYKLELQTPETIKLFDSTEKLIVKTKNGEKVPSPEVVEVVFVQCNLCNLVDNQYQ